MQLAQAPVGQFMRIIRERRSVRAYTRQPVPNELVEAALEAASWAPSAGNMQGRDFIVVRDAASKRGLAAAALDQDFIEQAPVVIVVCANQERSARRYGERGKRLYCLLDAAAAAQNLLLAIHALGMGGCWVGAFHDEKVSQLLRLPAPVRPIAIIPVGYPAESPEAPPRLPLSKILHDERYR